MRATNIFLAVFISIYVAACVDNTGQLGLDNTSLGGTTSTAISPSSISSMPYNGSVTGTNHSYYTYTTTDAIDAIMVTNITSDVDPEIYTDSTYTIRSTNWSCSAATSTNSDACTASIPVPAGTLLYIRLKNFAGASATFTLSVNIATTIGTAGSPSTVASMPTNSLAIGTISSYYAYTTIGTVGTITLSALTDNIDPVVYSDINFTIVDTNWVCTTNTSTISDTCTATTPAPVGTVLYIKASNLTASGATYTLSVGP